MLPLRDCAYISGFRWQCILRGVPILSDDLRHRHGYSGETVPNSSSVTGSLAQCRRAEMLNGLRPPLQKVDSGPCCGHLPGVQRAAYHAVAGIIQPGKVVGLGWQVTKTAGMQHERPIVTHSGCFGHFETQDAQRQGVRQRLRCRIGNHRCVTASCYPADAHSVDEVFKAGRIGLYGERKLAPDKVAGLKRCAAQESLAALVASANSSQRSA